VVGLLQRPAAFQEVLDRCRASDLEAARAVSVLLERGYARRREAAPPPGEAAPLLAAHELHALRASLARRRASGPQAVGKVLLVGGGPLAREVARGRFATIPGWAAEPEEGSFGTAGRLSLGEGVRVDVLSLPGEPELGPLWGPFGAGALGAVVLLPLGEAEPALLALARAQRLPLVVCGPSPEAVPEALRVAPGGMAFEGADPAEGLRALLAGAGARPAA
jgi:hypothetical protein